MSKIDETLEFTPKFDDNGLIPCITVDNESGQILMMAYMTREALDKTLESGEMHYWSRSRAELWHKGATSGDIQTLKEITIDCDQDCLLARVSTQGRAACHTGRKSCFYRKLNKTDGDIQLVFNEKD